MCGVAGWVSFSRDLSTQRPTVEAMTHSMACRGPDEWGVWLSPRAALGHRRLSVIDLPGGTQPMSVDTPGGPVVMAYSGETYNFRELRAELSGRGHRFRTDSDTEVVLRGYLEWGAAVAERLVGMCAIGIWDSRYERLTLIRDRMGVKPLHFQRFEDGVLFGSEPKAILAHPGVDPAVDTDGLRRMFAACVWFRDGVYSGQRVVEPGTVVQIDRDGVREHTYWRLTAAEHEDDQATTIARIRDMVEDNVRHELVADVPLGFLLSGGLDSSALVAVANRRMADSGSRPRTFSVDFPGQAENFRSSPEQDAADAPFVTAMVEHLGSDHRRIVLDHKQLSDPELRRAVVAAWDWPTGMGDLNSSLYLLLRAVREHVTVALSGEAADEVFAGHIWHRSEDALRGGLLPWHATLLSRVDPTPFLTDEVQAALDMPVFNRDLHSDTVAATPRLDGEDADEREARTARYAGLVHFLRFMEDRLDRMAMGVGLETRVPFCDHRLVQYAFNVPGRMHSFDGREKSLLRAAVADLLPASVSRRRKSPYPSTQDPMYVEALREQVRQVLASPSDPVFDLFDRSRVVTATQAPTGQLLGPQRAMFEKLLDMVAWLDLRRPALKIG
ncbi:asparagine synthase (glutamine-hydrolyzing) [Kutzneria sp. NPDC052558]|uniref:asparagine synthase (glutamine-hydrolyzing) n=1 Tax=Kutzneria sp. NPDC052558 TaxID=3364121 RepID=UPI0037C757E9